MGLLYDGRGIWYIFSWTLGKPGVSTTELQSMERLLRLLGKRFDFLTSLIQRHKVGERLVDIAVLKDVQRPT